MQHPIKTRQQFADIINENNYKTAVEIGVRRGWFSEWLLKNTQANVFSIDCWVDNNENIQTAQTIHESINRLYPYGRRSTIIKAFSEDIQDFFRDDCVDFVYIDALHEYNAIRNDLAVWWPKLKKGGCMSGHDYNQHIWPGVYRAVNEFVQHHQLQLYVTELGDNYGEGDQGQPSWYFFKP